MGWFSTPTSTPTCAHQYEIIKTAYAAPIAAELIAAIGDDNEFSEKETLGVTTLLFQCRHCHATYEHEMLGQPVEKGVA
jgi:hypothetical protein